MWLTAPRPCALNHVRHHGNSSSTTGKACPNSTRPAPPRALLSFLEQATTQQPRIETIASGQQLQRITDPSVNILWWQRPLDNTTQHAVAQALEQTTLFKHHAVVDADNAASLVTSLFPEGALRTHLAADAVEVVRLYLQALGMCLSKVHHDTPM